MSVMLSRYFCKTCNSFTFAFADIESTYRSVFSFYPLVNFTQVVILHGVIVSLASIAEALDWVPVCYTAH